MKIAIFIYDGLTALDAIGPYEVLSRIPGAEVCFVAEQKGQVKADTGMLSLIADRSLDEVETADILLVPGGPMTGGIGKRPKVEAWLKKIDASSQYTASVCTGSLILAQAGLLNGVPSTTHWSSLNQLEALGAKPVEERVVVQGKRYSAAGVSAGIDMALRLVADIGGERLAQALQLAIEYDPQPPFSSGSPKTAPAEALALIRAKMEALRAAEQD